MRQKYKLGTDLEKDELWKLLETKESDLLLAAELGSELEIEVHKTKEYIEQTKSKMKQIEAEFKQKLDQVEDLKCQVII